MAKRIGDVRIEADNCKGCRLCVVACPVHALEMSDGLNRLGYHPVRFVENHGCTGCGVCYYACPEPAAISIFAKPAA